MPPSYIRVRAVVWAYGRGQTDRQTHRRAWPQYILRRLWLTQNVMILNTTEYWPFGDYVMLRGEVVGLSVGHSVTCYEIAMLSHACAIWLLAYPLLSGEYDCSSCQCFHQLSSPWAGKWQSKLTMALKMECECMLMSKKLTQYSTSVKF